MQLTPEEMHRAAMACRAAGYRASQDAQIQSNPGVKATFERDARAYVALAEKLDLMWQAAKRG